MNLESCPPISKTVSTCGSACAAPAAWQVISSTTASAPTSLPMRLRPEPVVATARTCTSEPRRAASVANPSRTARRASPPVRRYWALSTRPRGSRRTRSVEVDPTSIPKNTGMRPVRGSRSQSSRGSTAKPSPGRYPPFGNGAKRGSSPAWERGWSSTLRRALRVAAPLPAAASLEAWSAAPAAWKKRLSSRAMSPSSPSLKTSRMARTTPAFSSTPPESATGASTGRPRTMSAL